MMGRVTWEGLPFPLPGRPNLVLTRNENYISPPAEIFTSVRELVGRGYEIAGETDCREVIVGGGAKLYAELLPYCDRLYVTDVHTEISGDAYFPAPDLDIWKVSRETFYSAGPKDDFDFTVRIYDRKRL